jgi:hypothetical protein
MVGEKDGANVGIFVGVFAKRSVGVKVTSHKLAGSLVFSMPNGRSATRRLAIYLVAPNIEFGKMRSQH